MKITADRQPLRVAYLEAGKQYGDSGGEADTGLTPFDEASVEAGSTFELPSGSRLVFVVELEPPMDMADAMEAYFNSGD